MAPTKSQDSKRTSSVIEKKNNSQGTSKKNIKPSLDKPACFKTIAKSTCKVQTSDDDDILLEIRNQLIELKQLNKKLFENVELINTRLENMSIQQVNIQSDLLETKNSVQTISNQINDLEKNINSKPKISLFTTEQITKAQELLNLDLTQNLEVRGRCLLSAAPFNRSNINTYGTKLLGLLFTKGQLANGTVESTKAKNKTQLDPRKIDKIKICYIKKIGSVETFIEFWETSITKSLRQKCLDAVKRLKKNPEEADQYDREWGNKLEDEEDVEGISSNIDEGQNGEENNENENQEENQIDSDENDEVIYRPRRNNDNIPRDLSMVSIN